MNLHPIPYADFKEALTSEQMSWAVVSTVRANGTLTAFCDDVSDLGHISVQRHLVQVGEKANSENHLRHASATSTTVMDLASIETSVGAVLKNVQQNSLSTLKLILDFSEMPSAVIAHFCELLMKDGTEFQLEDIFFVSPVFEENTNQPEHHSSLEEKVPQADFTDVLLFLGDEGNPVKGVVDCFSKREGMQTVAVHASKQFFADQRTPLANHLEWVENAVQNKINLEFYFSQQDALRVAFAAVDKAVDLCEAFPDKTHAFAVVPLEADWSVIVGCMARERYLRLCQSRAPNTKVSVSVLFSPNHLNPKEEVSLMSLTVFQLEM